MAREKYRPESNYENLTNPCYWVEWVDSEGEIRHCLRILVSILPEDAQVTYMSDWPSPEVSK